MGNKMKKYFVLSVLLFVGCSKSSSSNSPAPSSPVVSSPPSCGTTILTNSGVITSGGYTSWPLPKFNYENGDTITVYEKNPSDQNWTVVNNSLPCSQNPTSVWWEVIGSGSPEPGVSIYNCSTGTKDVYYQATVHAC
jgi:hypothetical protein